MSTYKHYDEATGKWIIDAAGNAHNIELDNELLQDEDGKSISVARGFQKLNNKISKLEHNLAWIYQNGAKGGGGGGGTGGGGGMYTIILTSGKNVFYTSSKSITINMTISSGGQRKTFFVTATDMSTGRYLVNGESHQSMIPFDLTIPNLPGSTNQIYLQAYDSQQNYTELIEITVNVGSMDIVKQGRPDASYTIGGNSNTIASYSVLNKTGSPAFLLVYRSRAVNPLADAIANGQSASTNFGADIAYTVANSNSAAAYQINYASILNTLSVGSTATFKTVLYSPTLDYASDYLEDQITITSGDQLLAILYDLGESEEEAPQFKFAQNNYCTFKLLIYYEKLDIRSFWYRYKVYSGDTIVYESTPTDAAASMYDSHTIDCPTTGFEIGGIYRLEVEVCATKDFNFSADPTRYSKAVGYFSIKEGASGILQDYPGALLARFSSFNFPGTGDSQWIYNIPSEGDYHFTSWPASVSTQTILTLHNKTISTGFNSNITRYMNLSGNTYATIDRFSNLFPQSANIQNSLMYPGFYMQITYKYLTDNPVDQCICSLGDYKADGTLNRGFEINSDYIRVAFGTTSGIYIDTPIRPENAYPANSTKRTETITVGLNVWHTTLKTGANTSQETYYFAIYIDGVMTKCILVPNSVLTSASSGWLFGKPLYLGCRSDLSNQANCYIYDFKLYAQNQPDLSVVWNYMSAIEQAHLIKSTTGEITIDEALDNNLRSKNLFNKSSNSCLLCDTTSGEYLEPSAMYSRIVNSYENYDLDYPVIYLQETAAQSDMYQCIKATWAAGQTLSDGQTITKKNWDVNVTITTKYGSTVLSSSNRDDINGSHSPNVAIQGTSSLSYNSKNLELKCGYTDDNKERLLKVNGWLPENEFTLKADVVDSAHVNNVAIGNFLNNSGYFEHYAGSGYSNSDNIKKKIKNTSEGFPCLVFIKYSDGSVDDAIEKDKQTGQIPVDDSGQQIRIGKTEFLGVYNFNLGRYAYYNLGLKTLNSYEQDLLIDDNAPQVIDNYSASQPSNVYSMEIGDNFGKTAELFTQADPTITEFTTECRYTATTEEAAIQAITNTLYTTMARADGSSANYDKLYRTTDGQYLPIDAGNSQWTSDSTSTDEATISNNVDMTALRKYLVCALVFGLVDSVCKNMVWRTWNGTLWYPAFYDMDTAFKMDNGGAESVGYDSHFHRFYNDETTYTDAKDSFQQGLIKFPSPQSNYPDWKYVYAGMCSEDGEPNRIWKVLEQCDNRVINVQGTAQSAHLPGQYWILRNGYIKNADAFIDEYFSGYINRTGAIMYNYDYRQKYVSYSQKWQDGVGLVSDTSSAQTQFLFGNRISTVRTWFRKRLNFLDSVYSAFNNGNVASGSYITDMWESRQQSPNTLTLVELAASQKCKIGYHVSSDTNNTYIWVDETPRKYLVRTQAQGNLWYLYGGTMLTQFTNFNEMGWQKISSQMNFPLFTSLNMSGLEIDQFTGGEQLANKENQTGLLNVQKIDMSNFRYIGQSITLGLAECDSLRELILSGDRCTISAFTLPSSGTLERLDLSGNINISAIPTQTVNNVEQSCLIGQSGLKYINLRGTQITDLSGQTLGLIDLPSLQEIQLPETLTKVTISNCGLTSLTQPFSSSTKLSPLTNITITECQNLETLNLAGQNNLLELNINNCPNLKTINISNIQLQGGGRINIDFTSLPNLESLDISFDAMFTELDLRNSPNLSNILAQSCRNLRSVRCTKDLSNLIELKSSAFKDCGALTTLTGYFDIQGESVFSNCGSLQFDELLEQEELKLKFDYYNLDNTFKGCAGLQNKVLDILNSLDDQVSSMSHMFDGSGATLNITTGTMPFRKCINVQNLSYVFANTNISGFLFSESQEFGNGILSGLRQLNTIEGAFQRTNVQYIDNNFFKYDGVSSLKNIDYAFSNCHNLVAVESTWVHGTPTPKPLQSKDFFINIDATGGQGHAPTITSSYESSGGTPNPDYPYPFEVFGGCSNVKMDINYETVTENGKTINKPYLFHLRKQISGYVRLSNQLYSGIELIMPTDEDNNPLINTSYLFGGNSKELNDETFSYYVPAFSSITSPFSRCIGSQLYLDLSTLDGSVFFTSGLTSLQQPFVNMVLTNTSSIPDTIFTGASNITSLQGFFSGLGLNNINDIEEPVYDFNIHQIFKPCSKLTNISSIFEGCTEFRMRLASDMFSECPITDVTSAFANSRVIEVLPLHLFKNKGNVLKKMQNVFKGCYNLGYDQNYAYEVVHTDMTVLTSVTGWEDHLVISGNKVSFTLPQDFFHYCTISTIADPIQISDVLADLFWPMHDKESLSDDTSEFFKVVEVPGQYGGLQGSIPEHLFDSDNMAASTSLTGVFKNTHFEPYSYGDRVNNRGLMYPPDLFNYTPNLQVLTNMFAYTDISRYAVINPDLFAYNKVITDGVFDKNESSYMPVQSLSGFWQGCTFNYTISENGTVMGGDQGSPQFEFDMFDHLSTLRDLSYMFAGISTQKPAGPHQISDTMFNFSPAPTEPITINYLFYNAQLDIISKAPYQFGGAQFFNGANTYLQGVPKDRIENSAIIMSRGLAPVNWYDEDELRSL